RRTAYAHSTISNFREGKRKCKACSNLIESTQGSYKDAIQMWRATMVNLPIYTYKGKKSRGQRPP
ncbi:MAG: hypothetical protein NZ526_05830, partial [Aquificaceae bacterium]|nr:hypothetical protein [Aquificaceae bacterium]